LKETFKEEGEMPGAPIRVLVKVDQLCYFAYQECFIGDHAKCQCRPTKGDNNNPIRWRTKVESKAAVCEHHGKALSITGWEARYKLEWPKKEKDPAEE